MPVWQPRAEWLSAAVQSALGQRGCDIELIVVDNGNTAPVARMLAGVQDSRLRIVRQEHGGVSSARNAGMRVALGDHFRFLDCDDVFDPDSTAHLLSLSDNDRTIAYGATVYCDAELRPYKVLECSVQGALGERALTDFTVTLPSLLFPRRVAELAGGWDETLTMCEDWDFVLRALEHAQVRGDTRVASYYRRHSTSAVGSSSIELAETSAACVVDKYLARHPEQASSPRVRRLHASRLTSSGTRYLQAHARVRAFARYAAAARIDPLFTLGEVSRVLAAEVRLRIGRLTGRNGRDVSA